jgi:hypothetical protein
VEEEWQPTCDVCLWSQFREMKGRGEMEGGEGERTERRFRFWWRGGDRGAGASWARQAARRGERRCWFCRAPRGRRWLFFFSFSLGLTVELGQ